MFYSIQKEETYFPIFYTKLTQKERKKWRQKNLKVISRVNLHTFRAANSRLIFRQFYAWTPHAKCIKFSFIYLLSKAQSEYILTNSYLRRNDFLMCFTCFLIGMYITCFSILFPVQDFFSNNKLNASLGFKNKHRQCSFRIKVD